MNDKTIAWFSCGATSAIACKYAIKMYPNVEIIYIETGSSHCDNLRFIRECEQWYGHQIRMVKNPKFDNVLDVISKRKFINGPMGASCTYNLKKVVRFEIEKQVKQWFGQVWGFEFAKHEINRAIRLQEQYPSIKPLFPLIEAKLNKAECLAMLRKAGIELPTMYKLGYHNNNCIGCVKGGIGYWNKIRKDFPTAFRNMAMMERNINATCLHDEKGKIFLDELEPNRGMLDEPIVPECGLFCDLEFQSLIDKRVENILQGKSSVYL